jgi:16S rRNA (uracil1498-N3)-methyltransferase
VPQFLVESIDPLSGRILLAPGEERHLLLACRGRVGETVRIFDGRGMQATALLARTERGKALLTLSGEPLRPALPGRRLLLLQGMPARDAFETVITSAVEAGVSRILPVIAERTARPARGFSTRGDRWRALVLAAVKQSLRPDIPVVEDPLPLYEAAGRIGDAVGIVLTGPSGGPPLPAALATLPSDRDLALAVGPEGGWSPGELATLAGRGFLPASLGPYILRCETAAVVAVGAARLAESGPPEE